MHETIENQVFSFFEFSTQKKNENGNKYDKKSIFDQQCYFEQFRFSLAEEFSSSLKRLYKRFEVRSIQKIPTKNQKMTTASVTNYVFVAFECFFNYFGQFL